MPFTLDQFAQRFPRLYHLTAAMNVEAIEADRCLYPAAETFRQARAVGDIRERRSDSRVIELPGGGLRHVRDQAPLFERKAALLGGWTFADLVQDLNERVYFWPGREDGPIESGRNHFARYVKAAEQIQVLVIDTRS